MYLAPFLHRNALSMKPDNKIPNMAICSFLFFAQRLVAPKAPGEH